MISKKEVVEITLNTQKESLEKQIDYIDSVILENAHKGETDARVEIPNTTLSDNLIKYIKMHYLNLGFEVECITHLVKSGYTLILINWGH